MLYTSLVCYDDWAMKKNRTFQNSCVNVLFWLVIDLVKNIPKLLNSNSHHQAGSKSDKLFHLKKSLTLVTKGMFYQNLPNFVKILSKISYGHYLFFVGF